MTDSNRNCRSMLLVDAPTDLRMPISRVRSETETSMIFIMPMPPTTSEIEATSVSMAEMIDKSEPAGCISSLLVMTEKF